MPFALPLRAALVRGSLVTIANWPVVLVDLAVESLYKLALVVPVFGGALMVTELAGGDLRFIFAEGVRSAAGLIVSALMNAPIALMSFVLAVVVVALAGALTMFVLKQGTLSVLVAAEHQAVELERLPVSYERLAGAYACNIPQVLLGIRRFRRRTIVLGLWLSAFYTAIGLSYLAALAAAVRISALPDLGMAWPVVVAVSTGAAIIAIAVVNVTFDLLRIIIVSDDCGVRAAAARLWSFLLADARQVVGIFAVMIGVFALATAASLLFTAGLALIAWVPFVGLVVLPLQAAAWLIRGLVFQYMALATVVAYLAQYRRFHDARAAAGLDFETESEERLRQPAPR